MTILYGNNVLTVDVVNVVNSHLLVVNFLPPEGQLISNTVSKRQRFGDPEMIENPLNAQRNSEEEHPA